MSSTRTEPMPQHSAAQAYAKPAPSVSWVLRRIALGLVIMATVTTLAALLAYASIESSAESAPAAITIGTPASALVK